MKKSLLRTLCCLLCAVCASMLSAARAADEVTQLVVELTNGKTDVFQLADKPVVTFEGTQVKVASSAANTAYERTEVKNFHFSNTATGIADAKAEGSLTLRYTDNATVTLTAAGPLKAALYNAQGQLVTRGAAEGTLTLSFADSPAGVYVLTVEGHHTYKLVKK